MFPDRVTSWIIKVSAVLALLVILWLSAFGKGRASMSDDVATAEAARAAAVAELADMNKTLIAERAKTAEMAVIAESFEAEKRNVQAAADRVVADLRAGNVQLRDRWQGCKADLSAASSGTGQPDATADDRSESAGRIVRAAAECDAQVRGLQYVIRADRGETR